MESAVPAQWPHAGIPMHVYVFIGKLKLGEKQIEEEIFVAHKLRRPLLGAPAIEALGLVKRVCAVISEESHNREDFQSLFSGLGKLKVKYKIQLKDDAQPFTLQWWMQDFLKEGSAILLCAKHACKFRSHAHFCLSHTHF